MHDLEEADRHLLDKLRQERRLSDVRLQEERRELYQKRRYGWHWVKEEQSPAILLPKEFERLLGGGEELGDIEGGGSRDLLDGDASRDTSQDEDVCEDEAEKGDARGH